MLVALVGAGGGETFAEAGPAAAQTLVGFQSCRGPSEDLAHQRSDVELAVRDLERAHTRALNALDNAPEGQDRDQRLDAVMANYLAERRTALAPLALHGNTEAMSRLAFDIRDSARPADIARWFALTTCAASHGHPQAADELVRWYWHQRREGSIAEVQRNRAVALDWADKAARAGEMYAIMRVAGYVSGNVHQYPGDIPLARRVLELCARTDSDRCEEYLVAGPYDYGLPPVERAFWLTRLELHEPLTYGAPLRETLAKLTPAQRERVKRRSAEFRAVPWADLCQEWLRLKDTILEHGRISVGQDTPCTTQTPWCRGAIGGAPAAQSKQ